LDDLGFEPVRYGLLMAQIPHNFPLTNLVVLCLTLASVARRPKRQSPTMRPTRRFLLVTLTSTIVAAALIVAAAFWSAQRALNRSAAVAGTQHQLRFTLRPLDPAAAQAQNPGFEPVSAQAAYTCGAFFAGDLYLAGPGGFSIYAPDGTLRRTLRTGIELPVAPIVAVVFGRLRGATDAQLLLATSGAGLLLLDPNPRGAPALHQLLPDSSEAGDLTSLLVLASGDLLLGTRRAGVFAFNGTTLVSLDGTAKQAREITALAAVDSASYLIGTRNTGVFYVHAGTMQQADVASGMPDNQVDALALAGGKAFAGTPLGTAEFDLTGETFKPSRVLAAGLFSHALMATSSELLIGSLDQGVQQLSLDVHPHLRNAAFAASDAESGQRIDQFLLSGPSAVYALADGRLLSRTANGWRAALPVASVTLADRNISALAFAPDGALYVGFFDHGLDILPANNGAVRHLEDDHLFCINRLALDPRRETIAAATANGLVLFDREGTPRQTLTRRDGLISDHVTDIAFMRTGMTLATPAGLTFITPSGTESLYAFQGLVNNHVYTLGSGDNDGLLAGTLGGISVLSGGAVKRNLTVENSGLKHNWITALAAAPGGGWFVGTYGGGVMTLSADGDRFAPIELPAGAARDLVINPNALMVTRTHVYAGTLGHGMLVLDMRSNRWSVVTSGLPSLNVTAFAERDGELYVGTENGLVRIAEEKLAGGLQ
jgi:ligand-binding sensor domain-containing protein